MEGNGLLQAIQDGGAEPHFFDEHGFDAGYFAATLPFPAASWKKELFLPRIVREVDHIVYLPRLSSHVIAGYTHGHKLAMGWLRDDSRHHVHYHAASFYEKYTEINYTQEIRDRLRLVLTLAESLLLHFGPDIGTIAPADPLIVIASSSLASHDALSAALLVHANETASSEDELRYDRATANTMNRVFVLSLVETWTQIPWGTGGADGYTTLDPHEFERGPAYDRVLRRAYAIRGGGAAAIRVVVPGEEPAPELRAALLARGGGRFQLV
jgi:uncharacterized protein (DUF362 family)